MTCETRAIERRRLWRKECKFNCYIHINVFIAAHRPASQEESSKQIKKLRSVHLKRLMYLTSVCSVFSSYLLEYEFRNVNFMTTRKIILHVNMYACIIRGLFKNLLVAYLESNTNMSTTQSEINGICCKKDLFWFTKFDSE